MLVGALRFLKLPPPDCRRTWPCVALTGPLATQVSRLRQQRQRVMTHRSFEAARSATRPTGGGGCGAAWLGANGTREHCRLRLGFGSVAPPRLGKGHGIRARPHLGRGDRRRPIGLDRASVFL